MRFVFLLLMTCFCFSAHAEESIPLLSCPLKLPHQEAFTSFWNLSSEIQNEKEKIFDWTPEGQNISDCKQCFTVQAYQLDENFRIKDLFEKFISTLKENIEPSDLLHYQVHAQNKRSVFFEWWVAPPYKDAQHEWIKMIQNKKNQLAIVRYVSKMTPRSENESEWISCVEQAELELNFENESQLDFLFIRAEADPQMIHLGDICIQDNL